MMHQKIGAAGLIIVCTPCADNPVSTCDLVNCGRVPSKRACGATHPDSSSQ